MDEIDSKELNKTIKTLGWYFNEKQTPTGFYATIGRIDEKLGQLISAIKSADESSVKLTKAINNITLAGVIIAGLGLIVAIANLILELIRLKLLG